QTHRKVETQSFRSNGLLPTIAELPKELKWYCKFSCTKLNAPRAVFPSLKHSIVSSDRFEHGANVCRAKDHDSFKQKRKRALKYGRYFAAFSISPLHRRRYAIETAKHGYQRISRPLNSSAS